MRSARIVQKVAIYSMFLLLILFITGCSVSPMLSDEQSTVDYASTGGIPTLSQIAIDTIEAENYDTQSGIQTETCAEGGLNIGWIDNGDYAIYNDVDFGSGVSSFQARVASDTNGGDIEIRIDGVNGTLLGALSVNNTGGWQSWITKETTISNVTGIHNLYLVFTGGSGGLMNINWITFTDSSLTIDAFSQIEIENYDGQSGIQIESCSEGGSNIGWIDHGDHASYNNVDFGSSVSIFKARVASDSLGGNIEVRIDGINGKLLGFMIVNNTGGWQSWITQEINIDNVNGIHDLYLVFTGGSGGLMNINWITFSNNTSYDIFGPNTQSGDMADGIASISHYWYNKGVVTNYNVAWWNSWAGVWIKINGGSPVDLSQYSGVKFTAKADDFEPWVEFEIQDNNGTHRAGFYFSYWSDYGPGAQLIGAMPTEWTDYEIPFSGFSGTVDPSSITEFKIIYRAGLLSYPPPWFNYPMDVRGTMHFDNMRFE